jgi:hypothetical protein
MKAKQRTVTATEFKMKCLWPSAHRRSDYEMRTARGPLVPVAAEASKVREIHGEDALKFRPPVRPNPHKPIDNTRPLGRKNEKYFVDTHAAKPSS